MKYFQDDLDFRSRVLMCAVVAVMIPFICYFIGYSAVIPGLNKNSDEAKLKIAAAEKRANTIQGTIIDSNGDTISYAGEKGVDGKCVFPAYGQLIGYDSKVYGTYGLKETFKDELWNADRHGVGSTVQLTTRNKVQIAAYDAIRGTDGCAVVIENKTGKIIALATSNSKVELDVNNLSSNREKIISTNGFFIPNYKKGGAPGSGIKVITSAAVIDSGYDEFVYDDTGVKEIDGYVFRNAGGEHYGNITLKGALVNSVNTYYVHMAEKLGAYELQKAFENFCIGETIELDFTTVKSAHNLTSSSRAEVAAAAFGQGKLDITPLNIAMVAQAIANDGKMLKPYLVESVKNGRKTVLKGKREELRQSTSAETARKIKGYMSIAAQKYGFEKGIYAKTGTAEIPGGLNRAVLMTFNSKYTVVVVSDNTSKAGKSLVPAVELIYNVL